ncbi:ABC-F family ATP-binding cassette domain-containing protein [Paenibacillus sp. UMB4589-SE434]|uniref:ABC-F family ATP-binding cassette domain-containing protein n=1 Tax=Paenibacillus sp. UMB4589-SE434 TaxID=3046314 RepID=UPI00254DE88B|nr:ABC-F family ATP-binding cassette domain-containing protein [Paenibacillus sp. UMB4589-SE434]MDK8179938.1 ABC-F family ATP-binding cassette domain-containing protein [Paenibacillus sp. UMB4589-SE434]
MSILHVSHMSHAHGDKILYKQVNFELYKGEHLGIVGQNGTGKSTLIRILTGEIVPDSGCVRWQSSIKIGHLDQYAEIFGSDTVKHYLQSAFVELYDLERELHSLYEESAVTGDEMYLHKAAEVQERLDLLGYYSIDSSINKVIQGLGLDAIGIDRPIELLSGGQRTKVILAKLLLEQPDVLLLDEPTNYLDRTHMEWLAQYLNSSEQAFIVVSHHAEFLEQVTTSICDIEGQTVKKYYGKYSEFLNQKAHLREDHIRQYQAQQKRIEQTENFIRKNIAGTNSRNARGRRKQLDRLERIAAPIFITRPSFRFRECPLSVHTALEVNKLEVGYDTPLLPPMTFVVFSGQKLVITGFNGIGKSTLLRTLLGKLKRVSGSFQLADQVKIGYYDQDLKWENDSITPLQIIAERYPHMSVKDIRRYLAQCGVKDSHVVQAIGSLSGGEQSKVKLCSLMLTDCNMLILDEPTNHLDAETKKALQQALIRFTGSIILVSHEEAFYQTWVDQVSNIEQFNDRGE